MIGGVAGGRGGLGARPGGGEGKGGGAATPPWLNPCRFDIKILSIIKVEKYANVIFLE